MRYRPLIVLLAALAAPTAHAVDGDPRDPLEPLNRLTHGFNEAIDNTIMKPLAMGYQAIAPSFVETGVRNFFSNLDDVVVVANDLLQFKIQQGSADFMRLAINSTLGLAGVLDVATEAGLRKHDEDFGQTLGVWTFSTGPYLVLPFVGPSNFRDATGWLVDGAYLDPVFNIDKKGVRNNVVAGRFIARRADLMEAKAAVDMAALDGYEFMRDFYLERRQALVHDGRPPPSEE